MKQRTAPRTHGLVIDWRTAPPKARALARRLLAPLPGGALLLASQPRFVVAAMADGAPGAFLVGVREAADVPLAMRAAHERMGEYHPAGGATRWALFVDADLQRVLAAEFVPALAGAQPGLPH